MSAFAPFQPSATPTWDDETPQKQPDTESVASVASVAKCREGIARMAALPCPLTMERRAWITLVDDFQAFAAEWLDHALTIGWTPTDLFGWHRNPAAHRVDQRGLVTFVAGRPVDAVEPDRAVIRNRIGPPNVFYRNFDRPLAKLAWDVFANGGR